ncbi:polysaccharide export protein [Lentisphaera profundi]|uniref:Polysaccharide export protein n=1 Tax=Lentisphaera profundi TaxID=1658616 RepID=A0ABY7VXW0_9BACT|nr:polysaccharide biosynthesis/export family protein [Lentisphaera profundi]WDE98557.1 polysaccharide export protein [Lentisphaera profundi]
MKFLIIAILVFLSSCTTHRKPIKLTGYPKLEQQAKAPQKIIDPKYFSPYKLERSRVDVGDELEISVFGQDNTLSSVTVAPDGKVYYLYGVTVQGAGLFIEEIADSIKIKLNKLFNNPEVSILPQKVHSSNFSIIGKIRAPGQYKLLSSLTLRQAINQAGGLTDGVFRGTTVKVASLKKSFIIRDEKKIPVNFHALIEKGDASQNVFIHPGDYIYIASGLSQEVYIMGAVTSAYPAAYNDEMTIISLLASNGSGLKKSAYIKQVLILRGDLQDPVVYQIDLAAVLNGDEHDIYLQPGDIIFVPEKPYKFLAELTELACNVFASSFGRRLGRDFSEDVLGLEAE